MIELTSFESYDLNYKDKIDPLARNQLKLNRFKELTRHHLENCKEYKKILIAWGFNINGFSDFGELPFIPASLFKSMELISSPRAKVRKTMTSSGTTGQKKSHIYLDEINSRDQARALAKTLIQSLKVDRGPLLIIDNKSTIQNKLEFSARSAGVLGFSVIGSPICFALNDDMSLDLKGIESFLSNHKNSKIVLFGFTSIIWEHFITKLENLGVQLNLTNAIMIHGGGWKKLTDKEISNEVFRDSLYRNTKIKTVSNYYGMVEQGGSIFVECKMGFMHTTPYNEIIVRRHKDFAVCDFGEVGIIQVLSVLPTSYPGHSILTEDQGRVLGTDDCLCGNSGKYFLVDGRLPNAEIRGCSDTYSF